MNFTGCKPGESNAPGMKMSSGKVSPDAHPLKSYVPTHILGNHAFTAKTFRRPGFTHLVRSNCPYTRFNQIQQVLSSDRHRSRQGRSIFTSDFTRYVGPARTKIRHSTFGVVSRYHLSIRSFAQSTIFAKIRFPCDFSHELRSSFAFRVRYESLIRTESLIEIQARLVYQTD